MMQDETDHIEGWPVRSLQTGAIRQTTCAEFRERIADRSTDAITYILQTAPGGTVEAQVIDQAEPSSPACRTFRRAYLQESPFVWEPEQLILVNEPCHIGVASGVVFRADGSIIAETVYPMMGERTIHLCIGGGLTAANIAERLNAAPEAEAGAWAPFFSRWSDVYGHAVAESLVQDSAFGRAGFSPLISYAATVYPEGAQKIVLSQASARIVQFAGPLIKVPKAVFASKLYRHLPLGTEFRQFVARTKARILRQSDWSVPGTEKIYVSRLGVAERPLTNEAELIEQMSKMGFRIVAPQTLSFEEQVRLFYRAELIVGPFGSGLTNSAFAAPNATLCELRPLNTRRDSPVWDTFYFGLAASLGMAFGTYVSENPRSTDAWTCDVSEVVEMITAASSHSRAAPFPASTASA